MNDKASEIESFFSYLEKRGTSCIEHAGMVEFEEAEVALRYLRRFDVECPRQEQAGGVSEGYVVRYPVGDMNDIEGIADGYIEELEDMIGS